MTQYNFHEAYLGPIGPHLNCLSKYTITRRDEDRLIGLPIRGEGTNTCGRATGGRQARVIAALQEHLSRHPDDKQSETHLAKVEARLATL